MKILELNFEKGWRGGERQTLYCLEGLAKAGIDVSLACRAGTPMEAEALKKGFPVFAFRSIFQLMGFLLTRARKFDILHAQTSSVLTYCVFTKWVHGCKTVYSRRVNFMPKGFLTRLKYSFADQLIAISPAIQETLFRFTGKKNIPVIGSIAQKEPFDRAQAAALMQKIVTSEKKIVGCMAAFTYEKDPFTAIEAAKILREKRSDFLVLHFGEGKLKEAAQQKIKEYGLENHYLLMGFVEEPQAYFNYFDVFIMTSQQEGLGSSVLDAFMFEVPVVATDAGGLKDLLSGGRGITIPVGNSKKLAEGIETMLQYSQTENPYIPPAKAYVEQAHGMGEITAQLVVLFKNCLKP